MSENFILKTDAYKQTHWKQYPPRTETVYSYFESRGGEHDSTLFFGLQYLLKRHFEGKVFNAHAIEEAEVFCRDMFGQELFNLGGWHYLLTAYGGALPIKITAVREGELVPQRNVLMTVENTDPRVPWLTNFCETLLVQTWYPITVATRSFYIARLIQEYCTRTGSAWNPFFLNDFGFRGVSSFESAGIGGMAHLVNFLGTDTLAGIRCAQQYYNADVCGHSVPAAEHSTITSWGQDGELAAYQNLLTAFPTGIVSIVCDSWDTKRATKQYFGKDLRAEIMARDGKVVVRPDSGVPWEVSVEVCKWMWEQFGGFTNAQGFKQLRPCVGIIYGDGIGYGAINRILQNMTAAGFATSNIVFGMGGELLQGLNRDTHKFAFKCSAIYRDGEWHDVFKQPITDPGKNSKPGRLMLVKDAQGDYQTVRYHEDQVSEMVCAFKDGEVRSDVSFDAVRKRAEAARLNGETTPTNNKEDVHATV